MPWWYLAISKHNADNKVEYVVSKISLVFVSPHTSCKQLLSWWRLCKCAEITIQRKQELIPPEIAYMASHWYHLSTQGYDGCWQETSRSPLLIFIMWFREIYKDDNFLEWESGRSSSEGNGSARYNLKSIWHDTLLLPSQYLNQHWLIIS